MAEGSKDDRKESRTSSAPLMVRPGYFECKRRIERLSKFQDLIRYEVGWTQELQSARPIEGMIGVVPDAQKQRAIEQAISRMVFAVGNDLDDVEVSSGITMLVDADDIDDFADGRQVRQAFDLINDYFVVRRHKGFGRSDIFMDTIRVLDEGIGAYETIKERAKFDFINPIAWCAWLMRIPISVLQRAGIATGEAAGEKTLRFIAWAVGRC